MIHNPCAFILFSISCMSWTYRSGQPIVSVTGTPGYAQTYTQIQTYLESLNIKYSALWVFVIHFIYSLV